ncbi:MAG: hypothetical protein IJZ85_06015 [Lachnospiraceae bacterium]|nr:hypothetical protein [Lachnospiraceae bacterium]
MKRRMGWFVIVLSLCLGLTACQDRNVAGDVSTEDVQNEVEGSSEAETTEAPQLESEEENGSEETAEETTEAATEEPVTEAPTTEAERISFHMDNPIAFSGDIVQRVESGNTVLVDLNGDGVEERLTVQFEDIKGYPSISPVLQIDELFFTRKEVTEFYYLEVPETEYYYLIDLDTADKWVEIAFYKTGPSSDPGTLFLRYNDGELVCVGRVPVGPPLRDNGETGYTVLGDGKITGRGRYSVVETSWANMTWKLTDGSEFHAVIDEEIPEYYEFVLYRTKEEWLEVTHELPIYTEMREDTDQIVTLPVGTKMEFVRHYPEGDWLELIYGEEENVGWIRVIRSEKGTTILPVNTDQWFGLYTYIDGFNTAD